MHSRRAVATQRSAKELARGTRGPDHPCPGRVGGCAQHVLPPGAQFDHEQDVEALQGNGIDGEEVARQHPGGLDAQEAPPGLDRTLGGGVDAGAVQDQPDRTCRDLVAQADQFALDPVVAPCRVFAREPRGQFADLVSG